MIKYAEKENKTENYFSFVHDLYSLMKKYDKYSTVIDLLIQISSLCKYETKSKL